MSALVVTGFFGFVCTLAGICFLVRATEQWRLVELVTPSRLSPAVQRILRGVMGATFVFVGVLFLCVTFIR